MVEARNLEAILEIYEAASGQCINFNKSKLSYSPNTSMDMKGAIRDQFGIDMVFDDDKYLGLTSSLARTKKEILST